ncbi:DinB family protein [Paucibacter sp. APW11]|uniref:DinB family protein n=1 Tax=Roseateles aquae TaxID=3077235 RepID=A0ABU3PB52_9BURK|nr:DinB family protein [Paucibacter sp. APW11]MDT8999801.1 DinB family protein [Paucibacter sp. APW11]
MNSTLVTLFEYKAWADAELLAALASFDAAKQPAQFAAMLQTLDHAHIVDRIFQGHLSGNTATPFTAPQSAQQPGLAPLREDINACDHWYLQFVHALPADELAQPLQFSFTDGQHGTMTREEMLLHVITHSGYHRGSIGQMLEDCGSESPPDSLTKFLHQHQPERRLHRPR